MTKENTQLCDFNVISDVGAIDLFGCRINQMKNKWYGIFLEYVVLNFDILFYSSHYIHWQYLFTNIYENHYGKAVYFLSAPKNCYSCVKIYL